MKRFRSTYELNWILCRAEELIKLFRKYEVGEIAQLGSGTNRYGLKLDGFVIKVATDHEGKVDNLKEFKMAKVLFPRVPRTYEVSENGLLLIAEYVQPFESFTEMMRYADRIREILAELSAVYLIGDVGITNKNFGNWGIRVGTDELVCLDFAYVYDVTSDLFICRHCHTNSMLVPNKDFTKLICPNKACQKETLFEDIRSMVSNEYHMEQIGDLSKEGYLMTSPNAMTELTEDRSNYLVKKRLAGKKIVKKSEALLSNDTDTKTISIEEKEGTTMLKNLSFLEGRPVMVQQSFNGPVFTGSVARGGEGEHQEPFIMEGSSATGSTCEFSGATHAVDTESQTTGETDEVPEPAAASEAVEYTTISTPDASEVVFSAHVTKEATIPAPMKAVQFKARFCDDSNRAISIISNKIREALHEIAAFDDIKSSVNNKKMYPAEFYEVAGNAIFKSLAAFLEFEQCMIPNRNNDGEHREFRAIFDVVNGDDYPVNKFNMLVWIERCFNTRAINREVRFQDMIVIFNQLYGNVARDDGMGTCYSPFRFDAQWLNLCGDTLGEKLPITAQGIARFKEAIRSLEGESDEEEESEVVTELDDAVADDVENVEEDSEDPGDDEIPEQYLSVEIFQDDDDDIVRVKSDDPFGSVVIPIYTNFDNIDISVASEKTVDPRNGSWDWITHMVPDVMFRCKDPEKYMCCNCPDDALTEWHTHAVIMGKDGDDWVIGLYAISGIYIVNDDWEYILMMNPDVLKILNKVIVDSIAGTAVSHLTRSLSTKELIHDEEYAKMFFLTENGDPVYADDEDDVENVEEDSEDPGDDETAEDDENPISGEAVANSTKVSTPDDYKLMGDIQVGDEVIGSGGSPVVVTGVYPKGSETINVSEEVAEESHNAIDSAIDTITELEEAALATLAEETHESTHESAKTSNATVKRDDKGRFVSTKSEDNDGTLTPQRRRKK